MDNPVDHIVDLGLVNYVKHPTNPDYVVFRFADENRAASFEAELVEAEIGFERGEEPRATRVFILYGVHKRDFKRTMKLNFIVEAKHKKPTIPFRWFRWFILLFTITAITLAAMGYCEQQKKLQSIDNQTQSLNQSNSME